MCSAFGEVAKHPGHPEPVLGWAGTHWVPPDWEEHVGSPPWAWGEEGTGGTSWHFPMNRVGGRPCHLCPNPGQGGQGGEILFLAEICLH